MRIPHQFLKDRKDGFDIIQQNWCGMPFRCLRGRSECLVFLKSRFSPENHDAHQRNRRHWSSVPRKAGGCGYPKRGRFLQEAATPKGRKELEAKTGIGHHHLLRWVNQADLFRVKGIGRQYAELLEKAGVDSVLELAERNPEHLHAKLVEVNNTHHHVKVVPSAEHVKNWVEEAKALPRVVQY